MVLPKPKQPERPLGLFRLLARLRQKSCRRISASTEIFQFAAEIVQAAVTFFRHDGFEFGTDAPS